MAVHLVTITETRDFVYEVDVVGVTNEHTQTKAKNAAQTIHRGIAVTTPLVKSVSCYRARPVKRTVKWTASLPTTKGN